jgi:hypothetical protein
MRRILLTVLAAAVLSACQAAPVIDNGSGPDASPAPAATTATAPLELLRPPVVINTIRRSNVVRWEDPTYKVVCWQLYNNGITCLPESQLVLRKQ